MYSLNDDLFLSLSTSTTSCLLTVTFENTSVSHHEPCYKTLVVAVTLLSFWFVIVIVIKVLFCRFRCFHKGYWGFSQPSCCLYVSPSLCVLLNHSVSWLYMIVLITLWPFHHCNLYICTHITHMHADTLYAVRYAATLQIWQARFSGQIAYF